MGNIFSFKADVVCVVYACDNDDSITRVWQFIYFLKFFSRNKDVKLYDKILSEFVCFNKNVYQYTS